MLVLIHSRFSPACIELIHLIKQKELGGLGYLSIDSDMAKKRLGDCGHTIDRVPTMILFDGLEVKKYEGLSACTQVVHHLVRESDDNDTYPHANAASDVSNVSNVSNVSDVSDVSNVGNPHANTTNGPSTKQQFQRTSLDSIEEEEEQEGKQETETKYLDNEITDKVSSTDVMAQAKAMQQQRAIDEPNEEGPTSTPRDWSTQK
jgi:hypothetical protein